MDTERCLEYIKNMSREKFFEEFVSKILRSNTASRIIALGADDPKAAETAKDFVGLLRGAGVPIDCSENLPENDILLPELETIAKYAMGRAVELT